MGIHGSKPRPQGLPDPLRLAAGKAPFGVSIVDHRIELTAGGRNEGVILRLVSKRRTEEGGQSMGPDVEVDECSAVTPCEYCDSDFGEIDEFEAWRFIMEAVAEDEHDGRQRQFGAIIPMEELFSAAELSALGSSVRKKRRQDRKIVRMISERLGLTGKMGNPASPAATGMAAHVPPNRILKAQAEVRAMPPLRRVAQ